MKPITKLLASLVCVVLTTSVNAASVKSCPVQIPGGVIQPGEKFDVKLDKMPRNTDAVYYNISCELYTAGYSLPNPSVVKVWTSSGGTIYINGKELQKSQGTLNLNPNTLEIKNTVISKQANGVVVPSVTTILNLDDAYPITVSNCTAKLVGN